MKYCTDMLFQFLGLLCVCPEMFIVESNGKYPMHSSCVFFSKLVSVNGFHKKKKREIWRLPNFPPKKNWADFCTAVTAYHLNLFAILEPGNRPIEELEVGKKRRPTNFEAK